MKTIKVAMLGFGSVGQSVAKILSEKNRELKEKFDTEISVIAIATKTRGIVVDAWGLDMDTMLRMIEDNKTFPMSYQTKLQKTALDVAETVDYDVLIEMTPLEQNSGKMATEHIMAALKRGKDVICTNKGPLAWNFNKLDELAKENKCNFLYETSVLDGTPLFSIVRENLKLCRVTEIKGILSRTLNYTFTGMEEGRTRDEMLEEGKAIGFIEANQQNDLSGQESLMKIVALANAFMGADMTPADESDIELKSAEGVTVEAIKDALKNGSTIKYICRAYLDNGKVKVSVKPEVISKHESYSSVDGASLAVSITTDMMGTMTIIEESQPVDNGKALEQTAYGVFSDLLSIMEKRK